jgi:hypothetical protein
VADLLRAGGIWLDRPEKMEIYCAEERVGKVG